MNNNQLPTLDQLESSVLQTLDGRCLKSGDLFVGNFIFHKPHGPGMDEYRGTLAKLQSNQSIDMAGKIVYRPFDASGRQWYKGEFEQGKRDGLGTIMWQDGTMYQGQWKCGQPDGFGVESYSNGDLYAGQFSNDFRHGLGKYFTQDTEFCCNWSKGRWEGIGFVKKKDSGRILAEFERGTVKEIPEFSPNHQAQIVLIREIETNSEAVETYSRQIQCLVVEKWKRWKFIDDVVIPDWPSQWFDMEQTRKRLSPRSFFAASGADDWDCEVRFISGSSPDVDSEECSSLEYELHDSKEVSLCQQRDTILQLDTNLKDSVVELQYTYTHRPVARQEAIPAINLTSDFSKELVHEEIFGEKMLLNSANNVISMFQTENSRLGSVLNQIVTSLEQMPQFEGHLPTEFSDRLSHVKNLAQEALQDQSQALDICITKLQDLLAANREDTDGISQVKGDTEKKTFIAEEFRGQWNELQVLNDRLPGQLRDISEFLDSLVEELLESACDVAVKCSEADLAEEPMSIPSTPFKDRFSISVETLGDGFTRMLDVLGNSVNRVDGIVTSIDKALKDVHVGREERHQVLVEKQLEDLKYGVVTMVDTVNSRLTSMDEKLKILDESNSHLQTGHFRLQEKLEMFLENQLPTLLSNQTAHIQQYLLQHLSLTGHALEGTNQPRDTSAEAETAEDRETQESFRNTMSVVGNIVQETVQSVADQINGMFSGDAGNFEMDEARSCHPSAIKVNDSNLDVANSYDEPSSQGLPFVRLADDTVKEIIEKSLAAYTSILRADNDTKRSNWGLPLGNEPIVSSFGGSMQHSHKLALDVVSSDDFKELIVGGSQLLQIFSESVYTSLIASISKEGPLALLLRKYVTYFGVDSKNESGESWQEGAMQFSSENAGTGETRGSFPNYTAALKRVLTPRSRNQLSRLEIDGALLLNQLGDKYVQSIAQTLCKWSRRNFLASAFCMQLGEDISDNFASMKPILSARSLDNLVQLGFEAEHLISGIGEEYAELLSKALLEGGCNRKAFSLLMSALGDTATSTVSQKETLVDFLSTRSVAKLESLMSEARTLLSKVDDSCHDVVGMLRSCASENLVAAAIYHEVTTSSGNSCCLNPTNIATQTSRMLERLLEQSAELMILLQEQHGEDILSVMLRSSAVQSPLAAVLYRELCKISRNGPKDPAVLRRVLSAKTKRNLDQILAEGRLLISKLGNEHLDAVLDELHHNGRESLLGSVLLYEIVNTPVTPFSTEYLEEGLSAQCKSSIEQLLLEGKILLMNINDKYAEGILDSVVKNSIRSPIARILGFEIMSSNHAKDFKKAKRSLSARSRKSLQNLLSEGRTLISALAGQNSGQLLLSICENVHRNTLASVLYFELVSHWLGSEGNSNHSIERNAQAIKSRLHTLLITTLKEGRVLLTQLESNRSLDIISTLYESRDNNPLSAILLHKILRSLGNSDQDQTFNDAKAKGREVLGDLLKEGQDLIECIGNGHAENILATIRAQVKPSPLAALLYNQLLSSFLANKIFESPSDYLSFDNDFIQCLDTQFCAKLIELIEEGQEMFDSLGDIYSKSLLDSVVMNAGENPMAALLYSDNLLSLGKGFMRKTNEIETIKSALSARTLKSYEDVLHEGGKLLETIDASYADTIVDSMAAQENLLSAGLMQEILLFVPDDVSQTSDENEYRVAFDLIEQCNTCEAKPTSIPAIANVIKVDSEAASSEILQRAFRMHLCKRVWRQKREIHFAKRLQCAFRSFFSRRCFKFWKKIADFINYPCKRPQPANNILSIAGNYDNFFTVIKPRFKISDRSKVKTKQLEKQIAIYNNKDTRLAIQCARNTIRSSRKRLKERKEERALQLLLQAQAATALRFSNLSLLYCIDRLRKRIEKRRSIGEATRSQNPPGSLLHKYEYASRKILNSTNVIQRAFRTFKCREIFGTLFVRRENMESARWKISKWITTCRALRKLRGERKRRIQMQSEIFSASRVQQMYRVHLARLEFSYLKRYLTQRKVTPLQTIAQSAISVSKVQKVWRGHTGRQKFLERVSSRQETEKKLHNITCVITIQCAWRSRIARRAFLCKNEIFCNNFFTSAANIIRSAFVCHIARKQAMKLRKSLNVMQQYSAKLAWLRTIEDLVRVSALEWKETCLRAETVVGNPKMTFTYAQSLAPAVFPTWWLSHFPVSLSCRVDLKAECFCNLEDQIRIDRTNALGGASAASFSKTMNVIGSLVNELTESHLIALGMSESYNVLVSLMAFCNIHGSRLISSIDEASQKAGNDLLMYALILADGPCLNLPGLSERLEYRRWTQSNLCRMHYLRSNFEKTAQCARFLISSGLDDQSTVSGLESVVGRMYLGAAQSKLGKHNTAVTTFQQALEILAKLTSTEKETEHNWKTFCCSKEQDRFYLCSAAHLAAVCFYNIAVECVACEQLSDSRLAIHRAHTLAQKESIREPVFSRRVKLTLVAIETLSQVFTTADGFIHERPFLSSRSRIIYQTSDSATTENNNPDFKSQAPITARNINNKSNVRTELSKKRFGAWFPPSVAFQNRVSTLKLSCKALCRLEGRSKETTLFLKLNLSHFKSPEVPLQKQSPRRLSPLQRQTTTTNGLSTVIILLTIPVQSSDVFEIVSNESENLYRAALHLDIVDSLHIFVKEFREVSRNFCDEKSRHSAKLLSRLIDLASLSIQLIIRNMSTYESGLPKSETFLKAAEKHLSIAISLLFGPLTADTSEKACDLRVLALSCRAILFLLKNDIPKANWVLADILSGSKLILSDKQRACLLLNRSVCLSLFGQHKESFDAAYSAWKILQLCKGSESWHCYSPSHHDKELTIHRWGVFASYCKFQLAQESFLLGFEGPCLRFADESKTLLGLQNSDDQNTDCNLYSSILAVIHCVSTLHLAKSKGSNQTLLETKSIAFKYLHTSDKLEKPVKYAWPPAETGIKTGLQIPTLSRISLSRLSRASEPAWTQQY